MQNTAKHPKSQPMVLALPKPRNKHLHDVLSGRHGGRMKTPKDQARSTAKQSFRRNLED